MKFHTLYNKPKPVSVIPDTETKLVDQSEADRASLKFQLERFGMDSLAQQLQKTQAQFGYADTRLVKDFATLHEKMAEANKYFSLLPSSVRKKFNHSAVDYFSSIEQNPSQAYKDGYISKSLAATLGVQAAIDKPVQPVQPVEPVQPVQPVQPVEPVQPVINQTTNVNA